MENRKGRTRLIIGPRSAKTRRNCMCCTRPFPSYSRFNRLCGNCKNLEDDFSFLGLDFTRK